MGVNKRLFVTIQPRYDLQMKLIRPTQAKLNQMSHAEKDALILFLFDAFEQLKKRVDELENTVKKASRNSSLPPSMDGLKKVQQRPEHLGSEILADKPAINAGHAIGSINPTTLCICSRKASAPVVLSYPH